MGRQLCDFSEAERLTDQKVWIGLLKTRDARELAEQSYAGLRCRPKFHSISPLGESMCGHGDRS
jgi:hypothetical protein